MNPLKTKSLAQHLLFTLLAFLLVACGGGGGGASGGSSSPLQSGTPVQQMGVVLAELSSAEMGVVTASWLPASEDPTIAPMLAYELHMNTPVGDFVPSNQTLKFRGHAALSAKIEGLQSGANYSVKLVVENASGQRIAGDAQTIKVSDTTSALLPGVQVTVLSPQQVVAIDDVANTLTLLAGTPVPAPGIILSSDQQGGFLLRVVSAQQQPDGSIVVITQPVALNEVMTDFNMSSSINLVPVPAATQPTQAGVVVSRPAQGGVSVNWQQTGFTLSSTEPRQALKPILVYDALQAGLAATEKPIEFSQELVSASGEWGVLSAPKLVNMPEGQSTPQSFDIGIDTNHNYEVCKNFVIVDDENSRRLASTLNTKVYLTTQGISPGLYKVKLRAYVDDVQDSCNGDSWSGWWSATPEIIITVAVTTSSQKFSQEAKPLSFKGGFDVNNTVVFQFDPKLNMDVQLRKNLGTVSGITSAHFEVDAVTNITQTLTVTATGAATLTKQTQELIPKRDFIKVFMAGPVPVVVQGTFWLDVEVSGNATGAIDATEELKLGFKKLSYGMTYDGTAAPANQWKEIKAADPTYEFTIEGNANATATVQVALVPHMEVQVLRAATAILALRPYLEADAGLKGKILLNQNPAGLTTDADAWLTKGEIRGGIDAYLYANLGVVDSKFLGLPYPANAISTNYATHQKISLVNTTTIVAIPTFTTQQVLNEIHPADSRAILIRATATDIQSPFRNFTVPFGPESFLPFRDWQTPKVVALNNTGYHWIAPPNGTGESSSGLIHSKDYWLVIEKPGSYTVRLGGNSKMGSWARQVAPDMVLNYTDANNDGIPDPWASKFASTNLQEWQVGGNPATPTGIVNYPPTASFNNTVNGLNVSFDASASTDSDGSIASYTWVFGDGGTASGKIASRNYAKAGTYTVKLIVTDNKGVANSTSQDVTVGAPTVTSAAPSIGSVNPNPVTGSNIRQLFTIYGTGFVSTPTLTLTWSGQQNYTVPAAQVTYVSSSQLQMSVTTTTTPDNWTVKVTNPDSKVSNIASFTVVAPSSTTALPTAFTLSSGTPYCTGGTPAIQVNWTGSSGVTTYDVYRNGSLYSPGVPSYTTTFSNTANLVAGQSYSYYVVAKNASGSTTSNTVSVTIPSNVCQASALLVNGFLSSYSTTTTPYQPTINLSGSGFNSVTQISWGCTMPNGATCAGSPYVWTSANWSGKFSVGSDTVASVSPTFLTATDPVGTYNWTATFTGAGQSVSKPFTVTNNTATAASLAVNGIASSYSTSTTPYQPGISLSGSGLSSITQISWSCSTPSGASCSGSPYVWTSANWGGKFVRYGDTSAAVYPSLLVAGDAGGTYNWSVTFSGGGQSVTKYFSVVNNVAVASLAVNGIASSYSTSTTPYQPGISLSGSGFNAITQLSWSCTMPSGASCSGSPYVWTSANWSGKFVRYGDTSAAVYPSLLVAGDAGGTYNWSVTFSGGGQSVTKYFSVVNNVAVASLAVNGIASSYSTSTTPYQPGISLSGSGLNSITQISWGCSTPSGASCSGSPYVWTSANWSGKFVRYGDTSAAVYPSLLVAGDAGGTYNWSVTFSGGGQSVTKYFSVVNNVAVASLAVNGIASSYSTSTTPYQPGISLSGSGFNAITQLSWSCTMPSGASCSGSPYVWTSANWSGKFVRYGDTSAAVYPSLLVAGDAGGTYNWSVTFSGGGQSVTKYFSVVNNVAVASLAVNGIASSYFATPGTYQPYISLSGSGFSTIVNQIYLTCARNGISCGNYTWNSVNWNGKYIVYSNTSAVIAPVLTVSSDPAGMYNWSITFSGGGQSVTKYFTVTK